MVLPPATTIPPSSNDDGQPMMHRSFALVSAIFCLTIVIAAWGDGGSWGQYHSMA